MFDAAPGDAGGRVVFGGVGVGVGVGDPLGNRLEVCSDLSPGMMGA